MLEIGQTLYLYQMESRHRAKPPTTVTVQSISRKWATIDHGRKINKETLWVDAGQYTPNERCYVSPEQRVNELALERLWDAFRDKTSRCWKAPTTNQENIRQAAALLNLDLP